MSGYERFALYYDSLTEDVGYQRRAGFFNSLIKSRFPGAELVLDLACGTGSLSLELSALGYDIIGVDASEHMLGVADSKRHLFKGPAMLLHQKAEALDLFGTVDVCICALDSLNHLPDEEALSKAISRVSLFLNPKGIFIFDINTLYKHEHILGCNAFVYENDAIFCIWRNSLNHANKSVEIMLDFFEKSGKDSYIRHGEIFTEQYFSVSCVKSLLDFHGFALFDIYDGDSFGAPDQKSQRLLFVAGKI